MPRQRRIVIAVLPTDSHPLARLSPATSRPSVQFAWPIAVAVDLLIAMHIRRLIFVSLAACGQLIRCHVRIEMGLDRPCSPAKRR